MGNSKRRRGAQADDKERSTAAALLPSKQDYKLVKLKQFIYDELREYRSPRLTEIVLAGRKLGLDSKTVRQFVQAEIPEYRQTTNKVFKTARPASRLYAGGGMLGQIGADLAFFEPQRHELSRIGVKKATMALVARDLVSRYSYCVPMQKEHGKSAKGLEIALGKLLEIHAKERPDYRIKSILFDAESAIRSTQVRKFLLQHGIKLHIYRYSKIGSAHSESLIRVLRTYFTRWDGNPKKWQQTCHMAAKYANELPIRIREKQLSFRPVDVTQKTLGSFLNELYRLRPQQYYTYFSVDTDNIKFKYAEKDTVSLKLRSFDTQAIKQSGDKRSEHSVDDATWVIVRKLAYFSDKYTIIKSYLLRPTGNYYGEDIVAEEDALVRVSL
jgi:hypothetical protein